MFSRPETSWRRIGLGLTLCAALACVSCWERKPRTRRPIDFVPSTADVIAVVDYRGFVGSHLLRSILDISQVEKTLLSIGISPGDILGIAGFAKIDLPALGPGGPPEHRGNRGEFAVIVQGKGGFGPVFTALSEGGWSHQKYEGRSFWTDPEENMAAALVRDHILAAGTPTAVRHVMDVAAGRVLGAMEPGSGSDCARILRRMGVRGTANVAIAFSQEMRMAAKQVSMSAGIFGGMMGANVLGQLFERLGKGRGVGLSFAPGKEGIAARVIFVAGDAASAKLIAGLVSVAKIVIPRIGDLAQMQEAAEMVRALNVASENELVLVDFRIPATILTREGL